MEHLRNGKERPVLRGIPARPVTFRPNDDLSDHLGSPGPIEWNKSVRNSSLRVSMCLDFGMSSVSKHTIGYKLG